MKPPLGRSDAALPEAPEGPSLCDLSRKRIGSQLQTLFAPLHDVEPSERMAELLLQLGKDVLPPDRSTNSG